MVDEKNVSISEGSGGEEMQSLISSFRNLIGNTGNWTNSDDDSAVLDIGDGRLLVFTTDSFVVSPIFFPGGNIADVAFCGTCNDIAVMGAKPLGISMGLVLEEGFPKKDLDRIMKSFGELSKSTGVPIVTGDTKVMEAGKVDKIIINTSGVGIIERKKLLDKKIESGDKVIMSGGIGEHAVALLSKRFDYETDIITDSKPLIEELSEIKSLIKVAKDCTRGGLSASLNELSQKNNLSVEVIEDDIPIKSEVKNVSEMLGINTLELACEGRFVCVTKAENAEKVVEILKKYNSMASIIGEFKEGEKVMLKTAFGKRVMHNPVGRIVPRIC